MAKRISDRERLEYVKQYKTSGLSVSEFAKNAVHCVTGSTPLKASAVISSR